MSVTKQDMDEFTKLVDDLIRATEIKCIKRFSEISRASMDLVYDPNLAREMTIKAICQEFGVEDV